MFNVFVKSNIKQIIAVNIKIIFDQANKFWIVFLNAPKQFRLVFFDQLLNFFTSSFDFLLGHMNTLADFFIKCQGQTEGNAGENGFFSDTNEGLLYRKANA